jgi:hypothetical protein
MATMLRILIIVAVATAAIGGFHMGASTYDLDRLVANHGLAPLMPAVLRSI